MKKSLSSFLFLCLLISCSSEESNKETPVASYAQPKEGEETVNAGEYIKIIDEETKAQQKQPRLINAKSPLHLGRIDLTIGDTSIIYNTFQKGYTDMHLSEKGVKMRIHDMYDASFEIYLNTSDVFTKTKQTYYPRQKSPTASVVYTNKLKDTLHSYEWISGSLTVTEFSTATGKIRFFVTGEMQNSNDLTDILPLDLKVDMRFEHVHSTVRPKK